MTAWGRAGHGRWGTMPSEWDSAPPPQLRLWGSGQLNSWGGHGEDSFQWLSGWLSLSTGGATCGEVGYEADKATTYGTVTWEGVTQASLYPSSSSP